MIMISEAGFYSITTRTFVFLLDARFLWKDEHVKVHRRHPEPLNVNSLFGAAEVSSIDHAFKFR